MTKLNPRQIIVSIIAVDIIGYLYYFDTSLTPAQFNLAVVGTIIAWFIFGFIKVELKKHGQNSKT